MTMDFQMYDLSEDRKIAIDMIHANPERDFEEIKYFLELDRYEPFSDLEWDFITYALDSEILNIKFRGEGPTTEPTWGEVFGGEL